MHLSFVKIKGSCYTINVPYYEIRGYYDGPTIFLSSGFYAQDINSIDILRNFIRVLKTSELYKKIKGRLLVFPIIDVINFDYDKDRDLNKRSVKLKRPNLQDNLSRQVLGELSYHFFRKSDAGILFVDSHSYLHALPFVKAYKNNDLDFLKTFGNKYILQSTKNNVFINNLFISYGTRVLTVEVGCAGFLVMNSVKDLMQNIKIFLVEHKALDADIKKPNNFMILDSKTGIKAKRSGIIDLDCNLKQKVQKGERLGTIYYPTLQTSEIIKADKTGIVFAKRIKNLVQTGQTIVTIV